MFSGKVTLTGGKFIEANKKYDWCKLCFYIHDRDLAWKLFNANFEQKMYDIYLHGEIKKDLVILLGHPHGAKMYISIGEFVRQEKVGNNQALVYDTKSCQGNSGGIVVRVERASSYRGILGWCRGIIGMILIQREWSYIFRHHRRYKCHSGAVDDNVHGRSAKYPPSRYYYNFLYFVILYVCLGVFAITCAALGMTDSLWFGIVVYLLMSILIIMYLMYIYAIIPVSTVRIQKHVHKYLLKLGVIMFGLVPWSILILVAIEELSDGSLLWNILIYIYHSSIFILWVILVLLPKQIFFNI